MADAIVSVLLEQLASIIRQQAEQEVRLVVGVEEDVQELTSNLRAIQAVLEDAEKRQVKEDTVQQWLDKLKDVTYDMDDVLDEWNTTILKMQIAAKPKRKVFSFILPCCFCFRQISLRRDIAVKIKQLSKTLDVISIEKDRYHFNLARVIEEPGRRITASVIDVSRMTASVVNVSEVHGREQDKKTIADMLLSESSQGPTLRIISIVGMGGIGKTTLAQLVYNDDMVKDHFQEKIWVCVSDPFDEIRIAKAILESLKGDAPNLNELNSLLGGIRRSLEGKKFLLVLDDVWTEDYKRWEQLKYSLEHGSPGSRILVTTRKENVAIVMKTTDIFQIGLLSKMECQSLLSQVAFFRRSEKECENLKDISEQIADKCKGLPLAAKTLGSLLCFKRTKEQWQHVLDSEIWKLEDVERGLFPPLLLSYYDLSPTMRRCFSYCAIFPKDHQLEKDELIKLWMAQGYLMATENEEIEIIGEECFENLVMRSFFQDFERDETGSIISCKMHDIVHDFAQFLTKNECLVLDVSSSEKLKIESSYEKARHLMMRVSIPISIYKVKSLRSLIVESRASPPNDLGLPKLFDQLTCLRALNFRNCGLEELPREVGKLIHLRYLNLGENDFLEELPETVCGLCNLQNLNVSSCGSLEKLPHGLGKLINLRHLEIWGTPIEFMPKGIGRLTCLRTLDKFVVSNGEASTLGDLENLNHIRGNLEIIGLGNVRDVDEVKKAQLGKKEHLLGLSLDFSGKELKGRMINDEQVFEAIQPPPNLEQLKIEGYRGTKVFPNWMSSLTNLKKVQFVGCVNCEFLPLVSSLESLRIGSMDDRWNRWNKPLSRHWNKERPIGFSIHFRWERAEQVKSPPNLERLEILWYVFPNWITSLTNLKNVTISDCWNLELLPPLGKLPSLESLTIDWISGVGRVGIEILGIERSEVKKNEGPNTSSSSSSLIAFPKLKALTFMWMSNWEEWDYGMREEEEDITTNISIMPRLRSLRIMYCPNLKALPDHLLHKCPSLERLCISSCPIVSERYYKEGRKGEEWPNISHIPNIQIDGIYVQGDLKSTKQWFYESTSDSE